MPLTKIKSLGITDGTVLAADIADGTISLAKLSATGTADATKFLRGDNSWGEAGAAAGQVIQVVTATDGTSRSTTSSTYVTASNTLTLSITPSSASNKILLMLSTAIAINTYEIRVAIFKNGSNLFSSPDCIAAKQGNGATDDCCVGASYLDSPATTSSITYDVRFLSTSLTAYLNYGPVKASLTALEIKG